MECPTVKVVSPASDDNPLGYIVINASDLTEDHDVFVDGDAPSAEPAAKRKYTKKTEA
jgi:hypothetical protein